MLSPRKSRMLDVPPEVVFDYLADLTHNMEWDNTSQGSAGSSVAGGDTSGKISLSPGPIGVGHNCEIVTTRRKRFWEYGPGSSGDDFEVRVNSLLITEFTRDKRLVIEQRCSQEGVNRISFDLAGC